MMLVVTREKDGDRIQLTLEWCEQLNTKGELCHLSFWPSQFIFEGSTLSFILIACLPWAVEHSDNQYCIAADREAGKNKVLRILLVHPVETVQRETRAVTQSFFVRWASLPPKFLLITLIKSFWQLTMKLSIFFSHFSTTTQDLWHQTLVMLIKHFGS